MSLHITLINPPVLRVKSPFVLHPTAPLGLALLAGQLEKNHHKVSIIDCIAENPNHKELFFDKVEKYGLSDNKILASINPNTQIIGISCMFSDNWLHTQKLIEKIGNHFPKAIIIAGGEHATATAKECIETTPSLKIVVMGEGDETMPDLANYIEHKQPLEKCKGITANINGKIIVTAPRNRLLKPDDVSWPAWHLFPLQKYRENNISYGVTKGLSLPILATRGCPYECTFCSSPQMWGRKYVMREPKEVFREIKYFHDNYGANNFDFFDLTAILKKEWIIDFAKILIESGINITWQIPAGTRAEAIDFEVSTYLYQSGCRFITYAPESGSERVLKEIKKRVKLKAMLNSIKNSNKAGLNVKLNMIIGFPNETHHDILKTWWFLIKCSWYGAYDALPGVFSAYPGTALFEKLKSENKLAKDHNLYIDILNSSSITNTPNYCKNVSKGFIVFYFWFIIISFYATNYFFRPQRFFELFWGLISKNYSSRAQYTLGKFFNSVFVSNSKKELSSESAIN